MRGEGAGCTAFGRWESGPGKKDGEEGFWKVSSGGNSPSSLSPSLGVGVSCLLAEADLRDSIIYGDICVVGVLLCRVVLLPLLMVGPFRKLGLKGQWGARWRCFIERQGVGEGV